MTAAPLFINRDVELDWLEALPYGVVTDGQPEERFLRVGERFRYLLDAPRGEPVGFEIGDFTSFEAQEPAHARIWRPPRFDAPMLALADATAGEIALAARASLLDEPTANRIYFSLAIDAGNSEEAVGLWRMCLECGDQMAHYGLGPVLYELGRPREAYRHLRFYAELVPDNGWTWCWLGKACEALDDSAEARLAYERAVALEQAGGLETDAPELLATLSERSERPS